MMTYESSAVVTAVPLVELLDELKSTGEVEICVRPGGRFNNEACLRMGRLSLLRRWGLVEEDAVVDDRRGMPADEQWYRYRLTPKGRRAVGPSLRPPPTVGSDLRQ